MKWVIFVNQVNRNLPLNIAHELVVPLFAHEFIAILPALNGLAVAGLDANTAFRDRCHRVLLAVELKNLAFFQAVNKGSGHIIHTHGRRQVSNTLNGA